MRRKPYGALLESTLAVIGEPMKRRIVAISMDGEEVHRTTTLPLTHYWQTRFTPPPGCSPNGMSGFASSEEKAHKAAISETNRIVRNFERVGKCGPIEVHVVPVRES